MGYTTEFDGGFSINPTPTEEFANYINKFADTRRMKRDVEKIKEIFPNWKELCYKEDLGEDGSYFVGGRGVAGQDFDESIIEYNTSPSSQPGLWCKWIIKENKLVWNLCEKFYDYISWLEYLIENFFEPEGYVLNGEVSYVGEDGPNDKGLIIIENNKISYTGNAFYG